ncbi:MAG: type II secretion system F family protein [Beijerinckiaceae bacterium]|nr:type II secretion system F family protein [Beijerinckiaceae bacterium]
MANEVQVWIVIIGTFVFASAIVMLAGSYVMRRGLVRSRLAVGAIAVPESPAGTPLKVIDRIDDELIGLNPQERNKLRIELLRAGYFSVDAPKLFVVIRSALAIGLPIGWYLFASLLMGEIPQNAGLTGLPLRWLLAGVLAYLGYIAPNAYVKRRQTKMTDSYRIAFPDFLDLLLVCVDAGLSLDAALVRVGREFKNQAPEFATNLALLSSEMRSGRSTTEALDNLSDRLGLDESRAFSTLLKQSIELGSNIGDALRIYADEMRDKRMMRAEARANVLPVKMVLPLGAFIFPVILIVILAPVLINLSRIFRQIMGG